MMRGHHEYSAESSRPFSVFLALTMLGGVVCGDIPAGKMGVADSPDGVPIHYTVYGSNSPTLIFVHGISCDQGYWQEQIEPFTQNHRVVTVDLAGHGKSGIERNDWTIEAYGADITAVVGDLALENIILIGHSMGGPVILETARQISDRVVGIVIVDSYESFDDWWSDEEIQEEMIPFRENFTEATRAWVRWMFLEDSDPEFVERIVTDMSSAPPEVALPSLEHAWEKMVGRARTTILEGINVPIFIINADFAPSTVESLRRHTDGVQIIPHTGHFFMLEKPDLFNTALRNVIRSIVDR